ncbi:MAG TPA: glycosyltransferase family 4 protein [Planctomycetota bacterium]|nr:glycosyltransferase family 4 protein [Planctomycetota bacterium]
MRIVYLAAGAGGTYCGACMRDTLLARGLARLGHELEFLSLYTPVKSDRTPPGSCRIFFGGINVYLQQHAGLFRHTPALFDRLLDSAWLLDFVGSRAVNTRPEDLGEMTVSVLRGEEGRQRKELRKLVRYLTREKRPDLVNITNSLLSAVAPAIKKHLDVPVVCNLQGEDVFIERIGKPFSDEAVALIRRHAASVDAFVASSEGYADRMAGFLAVDRSRIRVIRPGVDRSVLEARPSPPDDVFRIGYLSRVTWAKGIDLLCDAFRLVEEQSPGRSELVVAGEAVGSDHQWWHEQMTHMEESGLAGRVHYAGSPDLAGKVRFLEGLSVFCEPSRFHERQGLAVLEAQAAGVPAVLPDLGIFREIIALTGGGVLVEPDNPHAIAEALIALRDDPDRRDALARAAASAARKHFSPENLVDRTLELYQHLRT